MIIFSAVLSGTIGDEHEEGTVVRKVGDRQISRKVRLILGIILRGRRTILSLSLQQQQYQVQIATGNCIQHLCTVSSVISVWLLSTEQGFI